MPEPTYDRLLELTRDAEQRVLGCFLRSRNDFADALPILRNTDFFTDAHRRIYEACHALYLDGKPTDMQTVSHWLTRNGHDADVGMPYLVELWQAAPTDTVRWAEDLRDYSIRLQLIQKVREVEKDALSPIAPAQELIEQACQKMSSITDANDTSDVVTVRQAVDESVNDYDLRFHGKLTGLATGFFDLDGKTGGGLQPGEVWIIAARTGVGKTSLALNIVQQIASKVPVLFCSLEQPRRELAGRLICSNANIDGRNYRAAALNNEEIGRVNEAAAKISDLHIYIDDYPGQTAVRIAANARRMKLKKNGISTKSVDVKRKHRQSNAAPEGGSLQSWSCRTLAIISHAGHDCSPRCGHCCCGCGSSSRSCRSNWSTS